MAGRIAAWWRALSLPTRFLAALTLAQLALLNAAPWHWPTDLVEPALPMSWAMLGHFVQLEDSWHTMYPAYLHLREVGAAPVYTAIFFDHETKFQYPLTSLLIFPLFQAVSGDPADWRVAFILTSYGFALILFVGLAGLLIDSIRRYAGPGRAASQPERLVLGACAVLATAAFYPLAKGLHVGNVHHWIAALAVLALWCWVRGHTGLAGLWLGLATLLKPHYGLFLVWGLLRRRLHFAGAMAATMATGALAAIALFGLGQNLAYLPTARFLTRHGEAVEGNQSFMGLLLRMAGENSHRWEFHSFAPYLADVHGAAMLFAIVMLGAALLLPLVWRRAGGPVDLAVMLVAVTMASPIAWRYHYGVLIAVFPVLFGVVAARPGAHRWLALGLGACYLGVAGRWLVDLASPSTPWNLYHGELFAASMALLGLSYRFLAFDAAAEIDATMASARSTTTSGVSQATQDGCGDLSTKAAS